MTAFGVTNASADPVSSARANAFGISISLAGDELVEPEPEVTSVFPPGGSEEEDVATIDGEELALEGVGIQQAETSGESNLSPMLVPDDDGGSDGGGLGISQLGGGDEGGGDLLGLEDLLSLDELLGGGEGGDDGDDGSVDGFGGPDDDDIEIDAVNARAFSSINITGVALDDSGEGGEGGGGTDLFDDLLGDVLGGSEEGEDPLDAVTGSADGAGQVQAQQVDDILGGGVTGGELTEIVFEALLRLGVVESEAVAVCSGNQVFFDVASRIVDDQGADIELVGDLLDDVIGEVLDATDELAPELIRTTQGEVTVTEDGTVAINALRITVGEELGLGNLGGDDGGGTGGGATDGLGILQEGGDGGDDEPLLDIILGHSEVSGNVCAAQAPPADPVDPLPPAGENRTLPVTGGGLGLLPGILTLGLAGGAVAAGRVALRARREHTL
jgi:hypothetical protein